MAEEKSNEPESSSNPSEKAARPASEQSGARRLGLTPELRRFLNKPRVVPNEPAPAAKGEVERASPPAPPEKLAPVPRVEPKPQKSHPTETNMAGSGAERGERASIAAAPVLQADKASRVIELQQAILILGAILLLGLTFYFGTKFNYLKYLIASRNTPAVGEKGPDRFPGIAAEDLIKQALIAERADKWQDAVERFMAAKKKDLRYRGILFRVGKILYDHRNFDSADTGFERAIAFGENVEAANFYRGLIAIRRRDLPAAEGFFEAAVNAAPFISDYHYYWGEALRFDLKPKQSLPHYEQAALLARDEQDGTVCQFKIRMGRIEAAEGSAVSAELAKREAAGPLSVDWLMTSAALQLRGGHIDEARQLIMQARAGTAPGLFASCVNDIYFHDAAQKYPELSEALHLDLDLQVPFLN